MAGLFDLDPNSDEARAIANMSPYDALKLALESNRAATPAQASANQSQNAEDLLRMLPVTGQAAGLKDAWDASGRGGSALMQGNLGEAAHEYGNMGVGLLSSLFGGRGAGAPSVDTATRTTSVFVPAEESAATELARRLKDGPAGAATDTTVRKRTGLTFSPGGVPLTEVPDQNMAIKQDNFQPGRFGPLADVLDHPELFKQRPELAEIPTLVTDKTMGKGGALKPIFRTVAEGDNTQAPVGSFVVSNNFTGYSPELAKGQFAKLLQYKTDELTGGSPAVRHGYEGIKDQYRTALKSIPEGDYPPEQIEAYRDSLKGFVDRMKGVNRTRSDELRGVEPNGYADIAQRDAAIYGGRMSAGNIMARSATQRAVLPLEHSLTQHPYSFDPTVNLRSGKGIRMSPDIAVLPPSNEMSADEFRDFLNNWYTYGAGMPINKGAK